MHAPLEAGEQLDCILSVCTGGEEPKQSNSHTGGGWGRRGAGDPWRNDQTIPHPIRMLFGRRTWIAHSSNDPSNCFLLLFLKAIATSEGEVVIN